MTTPHLNRTLTLETQVKHPDGAGGYTADWQPLGVLWAQMQAGTGRELAAAAASLSRVPYRITVRASPQGAASRPVAGQRFRKGTRIFHILAVAEQDGCAHYLTCHAQEEIAP